MKIKLLNFVIGLILTTTLFSACVESHHDGEVIVSAEASIKSFEIEDIYTTSKVIVDGKEVEKIDTVIGKSYPFVINQRKRTIHNLDSLPVGTNVSRVIAKIQADSPFIFYEKNNKDTVWTPTDSLDFSKPISFKVKAYDMTFGDKYRVQINVHKQHPNQITWSEQTPVFANNEVKEQKAILFKDVIYVFANGEKQVKVTSSAATDGKVWSELTELAIPEKVDYASAIVFGEQVYVIAEGSLYTSADMTKWEKMESAPAMKSLIVANNNKSNQSLIGINQENVFVESKEGDIWTEKGTVHKLFPERNISSVAYTLNTNDEISRLIVLGENALSNDTIANVWGKLTNEDDWSTYYSTDKTNRPSPNFKNISMIHYNNQLYTFGGEAIKGGTIIPAFSVFYSSTNNGLDWTPEKDDLTFPESFTRNYKQSNGNYSCVIDNNDFIWIIWSNGGVWKGRINKLGFDKASKE